MSKTLLEKAQALLDAREQAAPGQIEVGLAYPDCGSNYWEAVDANDSVQVLTGNECDLAFYALAANTACETIQGYQDLVRRMADAMEESYKRLNAAGYAVGEAKIALLDEARAAIPPA